MTGTCQISKYLNGRKQSARQQDKYRQMVIRYFYKSRSTYPHYTFHDLDIMRSALRVNEEKNINSFLLRSDSAYYQILEGEETVVMDLVDTILKDSRHFDVTTLLTHEIETRYFQDWALGMRVLRPADKQIHTQLDQLSADSDMATKHSVVRDIHRIATRYHQRDKALPPRKMLRSDRTRSLASA